MELSGQRRLAIDRESAWRALNDPEVLRKAIPGCESLERVSDAEYTAVVATAIGPVRTRFRGKLRLEDVVAPESYSLRFEGDGGAAGFAKGVARVRLSEEGGGTLLDYSASSQIGGKLAQVGNRLVDSVARKLALDFFASLDAQLSPPVAGTAPPPAPRRGWTSNPLVWAALFFAAVVILVVLSLTLR